MIPGILIGIVAAFAMQYVATAIVERRNRPKAPDQSNYHDPCGPGCTMARNGTSDAARHEQFVTNIETRLERRRARARAS